ncbi:hypothetical protein EGW08_001871, partial [Elysia chlorotica]
MEIDELGKIKEAIACLKQTVAEGRKASNVDIRLMLSNIKKSRSLVRDLHAAEGDAAYSAALSGLLGSLSTHEELLQQKIAQLNQGPAADSPPDAQARPDCGDQFNRNRESIIKATIVSDGKLGFADVVGLSEAKRSLHDSIIMPLEYPHLFSGGRKPWRRILLYGPPGTGKTRLAQALSTEVGATFYCVSSGDLVSSFFGESEKLIKELFHDACSQPGQSVIFMDEVDSVCRARHSGEDDSTRRIKTELLIQMESSERRGATSLFLLCATNCPWDLDKAFLRRFQKRIYIPLPDRACRIELMKLNCRGNSVSLREADWQTLADATEGYSGSDLSVLTNGALFQPIRDL